MQMEQTCELCQKRATTTCEICGSAVCGDHKREYGCDVCSGGINKVE